MNFAANDVANTVSEGLHLYLITKKIMLLELDILKNDTLHFITNQGIFLHILRV